MEVREQMSRDADYDVDLFAEMVRSGKISEGHHSEYAAEKNGHPRRKGVEGNGTGDRV